MRVRRPRPRHPALLATVVLIATTVLAAASPDAGRAALEPQPPGAHEIPCAAEQEPNELPEQAPIVSGEACLTGTLPELRDQDLVLWDVTPADALTTWRFTVEGIPETITSVWVYDITSEDGVYPPQTTSLFRVDSDATSPTPGLSEGVALPAGRYLLGIARGNPADGHTPPPDEYRITIEREQVLPPDGDAEPNDDAATATPVAAAFSSSGAAAGNDDLYRWTLTDTDTTSRWRVDLQATASDPVELVLLGEDGSQLQATRSGSDGEGHLYDLALPAGSHLLRLRSSSGRPAGYALSAAPVTGTAWDAEPNDAPAQALAVAVGVPVTGRLAGPRDLDQFTFSVTPDLAGHQLDVGIAVDVDADRQVCLVRLADGDTRCRAGTGDITLSHELLAAGDYRVQVDGEEELVTGYTLAVTDAGPVAADREVEPNDTPPAASVFDPGLTMHGRSANGDLDVYRIPITGEPQVWRLDAQGTAIRSLTWVQPDGQVRGTADVSADGSRASLWDMALVPGDHWIAIETRGEDYTLTLTPMGPRADGAEREPNNDRGTAEPIELDVPRTGRVPGPADTDVYRFSLGTAEQLTIRLDPPAEAAIRVAVSSGTEDLARVREPEPGVPWVHRMALPAGDYEISLSSVSGSVDPYTLTVTREDPFADVADLEPNDTLAAARPIGPSLHVDGRGFGATGEDDDWYVLPPLTAEAAVTIRATGGAVLQELREAATSVRADRSTDGTIWTTAALPAGTRLFLNVSGTADYTLAIASDGLPGPVADAPLPLAATLTVDTPEIAAYTDFGQRLSGTLRLASSADEPQTLALDAVATHPDWSVALDTSSVTVPAGGSVDVPVVIVAARDAWADEPVRVTVRAAGPDGSHVTAAADMTPRRDGPLVAPEAWWPVPGTMLGGLDVASAAMGGAVVPSDASGIQPMLHDGLAMTGIGLSGRLYGDPLTFTVDLAGDDPVPVAGFILDPLAQYPALSTSPRHVELLLSDDGGAWTSVATAELSPRTVDQAIPLAAPLPARFAQLRILDTYGGTDSYVNLGEWQVIASPDWQPGRTFNVADPVLGGHVAWMTPGFTDPRQPDSMLSETAEPQAYTPWIAAGTPIRWALAFAEDRAAQVTALEWVDAPGGDPALRFPQVDVAISTDSALGPWRELGTWDLARAADGSVAPFALPAGTWARFVRFTAPSPTETSYREFPTTIRAVERPVDGEYRSIVGAWGRGERTAILEALVPPDPSALELAFDLTDGNDTPEMATPLVADAPVDARIRRGQDVDWYTLTVPATDNVLELRLGARPDAGLVVTAQDAAGTPIELESAASTVPGELVYVGAVEPGTTVRVRVEQAPLSTVFTYDTSGSMGTYLSYVTAALRGFAADIIPGEEAVLVMPFGDLPLLRDWSDDPYAIESAIAGAGPGSGSSSAETSLIEATKGLALRPGARAILAITDAETTSYGAGADLWSYLDQVRPIVFTVHVAGGGAPAMSTDLMQDWAASWGGRYEYASSHAQIDRAFDRLATWLRRPAAYRLAFGTRSVNRNPGSLALDPPTDPASAGGLVAGSGVAVEILLDTSGSMLEKTQGGRRIDVAKQVLRRLIGETLAPGLPTALRIFTPGKRSCASQLLAPLGPLDPTALTATVNRLKIDKGTRTPLAATLREVAGDLAQAEGLRLIVLITDGQESCKGDPEAVIRELAASGLDVRVNIVGFDIDDAGLREQIARWAEAGNGQAFDANGADGLETSIAAALAAPFRVLDADGVVVGTGVVGGEPVPLPPGSYRVEVLTDPPIVLDPVEIPAEQQVRLTVEPAAAASPAP